MTLTLWGLKLVAPSLVFQRAAFRVQTLAFMQRLQKSKLLWMSCGIFMYLPRWVVLADEERYKDMDENIESLQCVCR